MSSDHNSAPSSSAHYLEFLPLKQLSNIAPSQVLYVQKSLKVPVLIAPSYSTPRLLARYAGNARQPY